LAPARLAPVRSRRLKLAPDRSQPGHSLTWPARKSSRWPACAPAAGHDATAATARKATAGRPGYDMSFIYLSAYEAREPELCECHDRDGCGSQRANHQSTFHRDLTLLVPHENLPYLASLLGIKIAANEVLVLESSSCS